MRDELNERILSEANYIIEHKATVRDCGKRFGISKSTVHKDMSQRLVNVNSALYSLVRTVSDENKAQRHLRGGMATKRKYQLKKDEEVLQTNH